MTTDDTQTDGAQPAPTDDAQSPQPDDTRPAPTDGERTITTDWVEDIAVGGFDDTPLARLVTPALTTMRIEMVDLGLDVINRLVRLMESREPDAPYLRLPALVVRQTTGAAHA